MGSRDGDSHWRKASSYLGDTALRALERPSVVVLRRSAVGQQERLEDIASSDGWLSEGHGLDLTFLATAPNFETKTNGATHMGNDDTIVFGGIAGLKIIDVSCPNQLIGVMKWIMEGNRGLCYVRIMRSASAVLYPEVPAFEFGNCS